MAELPKRPTRFLRSLPGAVPAPTTSYRTESPGLTPLTVLDGKVFDRHARAGGAIGGAIQEIGGQMGAIIDESNRAKNQMAMRSVDDAVGQAEAEMKARWDAEPDPEKWTGITEQVVKKTRESVKLDAMSPAAREAAAVRLDAWGNMSAKNTTVKSHLGLIDKRNTDTKNRWETAFLNNDEEGELQLRGQLVGDGVITEATGELMGARAKKRFAEEKERNERKQRAANYDYGLNGAIQAAADAGEDEALKALDSGMFGTHDATDKERIRSAIQSTAKDRAGSVLDDLADGIVSGKITNPAAIDALESPHLTPALRAKAKAELSGWNADQARADREQNGVRNAVELRQKVKAYDPAADPTREQLFSLNRQIRARVDEVNSGELTQELYQKYGTKPPKPVETRPEIQRNVSKSLDVLFDPVSGSMPWRIEATDPTGKKTVTEDPATRQAAIDAQTKVEMGMADWMKQNPDKANSLPEVQKRLGELLPEGTRAGALGTLRGLMSMPTAAPQASASPPAPGTLPTSIRGFEEPPDLQAKLPAGLKPHAQDFIDAARETGLNPRVLAAISALETGGGTSKAFREKMNAMGISDDSGPTAQASVRDSIFKQARTLAREGGPYAKAKTLDEIGAIYAPPGASNDFKGTNDGWAENVRAWLARL